MTRRFAALLFSLLWTPPLSAADKTTAREFITEPPTLVSLGFEWQIDGDDNRNATVSVSSAGRASRPGKWDRLSCASGTSGSTRTRSVT
jgi:hypothetical protein